MYRLSEEIATKILKSIKNPDIGELDINSKTVFLPQNKRSIGLIDPFAAIGLDMDYILEVPYSLFSQLETSAKSLQGYWLYKKGELSKPEEPIEIPKALVDINLPKDSEELLDVSDCCVQMPGEIDKLTCPLISSLDTLLAKEPLLLDCLNLGEKK
jgi:hypothetical protein